MSICILKSPHEPLKTSLVLFPMPWWSMFHSLKRMYTYKRKKLSHLWLCFLFKEPGALNPMKQLAFLVTVRWIQKHYRLTACFILVLFTYVDKRLQLDSGSGHNVHCLGLYTVFEGHISEQIGKLLIGGHFCTVIQLTLESILVFATLLIHTKIVFWKLTFVELNEIQDK